MSEPIPESIPTSQDPRSRRPTKKRALTPVSEQAANVDALFAKPDQEIRIPDSNALAKRQALAPPEIVANVQGSSAGAGSGEFHVYKASRRREYERIRAMEDEVKKEKDDEEFEREKREREERDAEKTRKNREKREKKRKNKGKGGETKGPAGSVTATNGRKASGAGNEVKTNVETEDLNGQAEVAPEAGLVIHDDD